MDPSKSKRPPLPRLATDVLPPQRPAPRPATIMLPLASVPLPEISVSNLRRTETAPSLNFKEVTNEENLLPLPTGRYATDKAFYATETSVEDEPLTKKKQQYYEEVFGVRGSRDSPQERIHQDSVVVAELKMGSMVKYDRSRLAGDVLFRLSQVYQRPEKSIMVTVQQDTCVLFGNNNTLAAYLLTIYALPTLIAPVSNVRSTSLIQKTLEERLGIPPNLGVIIFIPIPEENLATNGMTIRSETSMIERSQYSPSIFKSISRGMSRRLKNRSGDSAQVSHPSAAVTAAPSPHSRSDSPASPRDREWSAIGKNSGFRNYIFQLLKDKVVMEVEEQETKETDGKETQDRGAEETKQSKQDVTETVMDTENVNQ